MHKLEKNYQKKLEDIQMMQNIIAKYLRVYMKDMLEVRELDPHACAYQLQLVFGEKILRDIDGFIEFSLREIGGERQVSDSDIQVTLAHDLGGALRYDTKMLPRVSDYGQYSINKVFKGIPKKKIKKDE